MRDDLRALGAEIRAGIIERLCSDLDLDEDDLRALLREEFQSEIEDSIVNDADEILKARLKEEVKSEMYEEVHDEIYNECGERIMQYYRADDTFVSDVKAELHSVVEAIVMAKLRAE